VSEESDEFNTKGLDALIKALKHPPMCKIGVLGKNSRSSSKGGVTSSNATIGAVHEFGSVSNNIAQRSFLRKPITDKLEKYLEKSQAFDKDTLREVLKKSSFMPIMRKVAVTAEAVVQDAFATGGFGEWPKWKDGGYQNNTGQLLIDTRQLRDSITSEVEET
jgi:phage gpG-like protein